MLLPQVPFSFRKKIAAELGINIGVFSAKLATEFKTEDNRISRLKAIEHHILLNEEVGTVEAPRSWIKGDDLARMFQITTSRRDGAFFCLIESPAYLVGLGGFSYPCRWRAVGGNQGP